MPVTVNSIMNSTSAASWRSKCLATTGLNYRRSQAARVEAAPLPARRQPPPEAIKQITGKRRRRRRQASEHQRPIDIIRFKTIEGKQALELIPSREWFKSFANFTYGTDQLLVSFDSARHEFSSTITSRIHPLVFIKFPNLILIHYFLFTCIS